MFIYIIIIVKTVSLPFLSFIVNTLIRDNIKSTHKLLHGMTDHFFLGLNGLWHVRLGVMHYVILLSAVIMYVLHDKAMSNVIYNGHYIRKL